jgi:hypothetical protein
MSDDQQPPADVSDTKPTKPPGDVQSDLEEVFFNHPGFMAYGIGFEVLHADWPAYPLGHGLRAAIATLADYPVQSYFSPVDNIDHCTLFVLGDIPEKNPYDEKFLHVAIWDEDLIELSQLHLLDGMSVVGGSSQKMTGAPYLQYDTASVILNDLGHEFALFLELTPQVRWKLLQDLMPIILAGKYDSVVRDAAVGLESRMKAICKTESYGLKLVEECLGENGILIAHTKLSNSTRLELRSMFRRFFKFVRNEVAHNEVDFDILSTARMLNKCSILHDILDKFR